LPIVLDDTKAYSPQAADQPRPARACRVLVVDDNQSAAKVLSLMLKMLGHESRTAFDGQQACEIAAEYLPDVVLMDLGMPKMDGYEAARAIRRQAWSASMVLVALTGWEQDEHRRRSQEAGFDHHLVKPVAHEQLTQLLMQVSAREADGGSSHSRVDRAPN
jgi:CheY-like chemotaxis protein